MPGAISFLVPEALVATIQYFAFVFGGNNAFAGQVITLALVDTSRSFEPSTAFFKFSQAIAFAAKIRAGLDHKGTTIGTVSNTY